jgi:hypothetical protein
MASEGRDKLQKLARAGVPVDALNERLIARITELDDDELDALVSIREKLNAGLDDRLRDAADNVGVVVW